MGAFKELQIENDEIMALETERELIHRRLDRLGQCDCENTQCHCFLYSDLAEVENKLKLLRGVK